MKKIYLLTAVFTIILGNYCAEASTGLPVLKGQPVADSAEYATACDSFLWHGVAYTT